MSDKPKRKNSSNRRRKFLMIFIAFDVVVVIGLFALIPQFNAWLDSDPFTPPCHFEEDRYIYGYTSIPDGRQGFIANLNDSSYIKVGYSELYRWSPDGELFAYIDDSETHPPQLHMIDLKSGEDKTLELPDKPYDVFTPFVWSPDSNFVVIQPENTNTVMLADRNLSETTNYDDFGEILRVLWSPDRNYLGVEQAPSQNDILLNIQTGEIQTIDDIFDYRNPIAWLDGEHLLYQTLSKQIFIYDVETQESQLWIDGYINLDSVSMSQDKSWAIVEDENIQQLYHLSDNSQGVLTIKSQTSGISFEDGALWQISDDFLYLYELDTGNQITLPRTPNSDSPITLIWHQLSPSRNYILYSRSSEGESIPGTLLYNLRTGEDIQLPHNSGVGLGKWYELDGEEWLNYRVITEGEYPKTLMYLFNPNNNTLCKLRVFDSDSASIRSWQKTNSG